MKKVKAQPRLTPFKDWLRILMKEQEAIGGENVIQKLCSKLQSTFEIRSAWSHLLNSSADSLPAALKDDKKLYNRTLRKLVEIAETNLDYYEIGSATTNALMSSLVTVFDKETLDMGIEEKKEYCKTKKIGFSTIERWRRGDNIPKLTEFCSAATALNMYVVPDFFRFDDKKLLSYRAKKIAQLKMGRERPRKQGRTKSAGNGERNFIKSRISQLTDTSDPGLTNFAEIVEFLFDEMEIQRLSNKDVSTFSCVSEETLSSWNSHDPKEANKAALLSLICSVYETLGLTLTLSPIANKKEVFDQGHIARRQGEEAHRLKITPQELRRRSQAD